MAYVTHIYGLSFSPRSSSSSVNLLSSSVSIKLAFTSLPPFCSSHPPCISQIIIILIILNISIMAVLIVGQDYVRNLTHLSHKMKPLSLMVGTVCWGFIWESESICQISKSVLGVHLRKWKCFSHIKKCAGSSSEKVKVFVKYQKVCWGFIRESESVCQISKSQY